MSVIVYGQRPYGGTAPEQRLDPRAYDVYLDRDGGSREEIAAAA